MDNLSIVVLNYNGKDVLQELLISILIQKHTGDEVLIIDNQSTDGSEEIGKKYGTVVLENNKNQFVGGLNKAFEYAKNEKVLFLSNDLILKHGFLDNRRKEITSDRVVQPVFYTSEGIQNAGADFYYPMLGMARKAIYSILSHTPVFATTAFGMTKTTFKNIGKFDENLAPAFLEDIDYSFRAKKLGVDIFVVGNAWCYHHTSHTFGKKYGKTKISGFCERNRIYLIRKHYKGVDKFLRLITMKGLQLCKSLLVT